MQAHDVIVDGPTTTLILPRYFAKRPWTIPTAAIGVQDLTRATPGTGEVLVFERAPKILNVEGANHRFQSPTTALLFTEPQRVPRSRLFPASNVVGRRATRSAEGVLLDGVTVAFRDPALAQRTLVAAGAEAVADDLVWWRRWRTTRSDAIEGRHLLAAGTTLRRRLKIAFAMGWAMPLLLVVYAVTESVVAYAAAIGSMVTAMALAAFAVRGANREARAARAEADQRTPFEGRS